VDPGDTHTVLLWAGGELRAVDSPPAGALLAADSWLVDEGRVRGYDRHQARFRGWCEALRVAPAELARFQAAVTAALPRAGRWFPRVDLVGSAGGRAGAAQLVLRLRPAQPLKTRARVLVGEPGDPRGHPRVKGPDLPLLLGMRAEAVAAGADEVMLRDAGGRLLEGALNALLWWEDGALCSPPAARTLASVTRELLFEIARASRVEVVRRSPLPCELDGQEAWLANAAHGICAVVAWEPAGPAAGAADRAAEWHRALDATARHLDG
jgi:branched-subunit amino acid aminotransferase/4-amino-4-deoxychorismate lyase